jgi:hypothetical protein
MFSSPCTLELVKQLPGPSLVLTDSPGGFATNLLFPAGIRLLPFLRGPRPASALPRRLIDMAPPAMLWLPNSHLTLALSLLRDIPTLQMGRKRIGTRSAL